MQTSDVASNPPKTSDGSIVLRNTMYLGVAEILIVPITIALNGLMGRYLGPEEMGYLYVSMTITKFAFLVVEWGHNGSLPAAVVHDRESAGKLLGSSLVWRLGASALAYSVVGLGCHLLGYDVQQQLIVGLAFLLYSVGTLLTACQDVIRGFERTDIAAYARVGSQFLTVLLVMPVLVLGGHLPLVLLAQSFGTLLVLLAVSTKLRPVGVGAIGWRPDYLKKLLAGGTPFVFFGFGLVFQPSIDAFFLSRLSAPDVVGWFAVAQKLVGFLLLPASALIGALYPTLCRLFTSDLEGYRSTTRNAISAVSLLMVPAALGCALFPDVGVSIFGREAFRPAEDTLRIFSIFLVLVYFSLPVGTAMIAAGRQRSWAGVQLVSIASSAIFDPILIKHFQERYGNGGMGLAFASTIAESIMVIGGVWLTPPGIFNRALGKTLGLAVLSGGAMAATSAALRPSLPPLVVAPLAVGAYVGALLVTGAITREQRAAVVAFVRRKLARNRSGS